MKPRQKILALDPANSCGYAHSSGQRGVWLLGDPYSRLQRFRNQLLQAADRWGCDLLAYEDAAFGSINPHTAAAHNELAGIIKLVAAELCVETRSYKPATIKKFATGSGRAQKPQMIRACETILGLRVTSDDEADAIWILEMAKQNYLPAASAKKRTARRAKKAPRLF